MGVSLSDLMKVLSKDDVLTSFISLLRLGGFPVASWHSGSLQKHTAETESSLLADLTEAVRNSTKGGFIKLAAEIDDAWVDLCAENVFAETRKAAVYTQGSVRLTDAGGSGPHTISPGGFWVANEDRSLRFVTTNATNETLPMGGTLTLTFQAESPGANYNVGNGALVEALTPLPGVTVENIDPGTGTWITQQGTDAESNEALVQRCLDKWSTIGSGSDEAAYRYYATSASNEITRAKVYSPGAGSVRVVVGGASGPVSSTALAAAVALIESKRPLGVPDVVTSNAIARAQTITGVLYVDSGRDLASTLSAAQAAVDARARLTAIGGKVSRERIIRELMVDGVNDLTLSAPADDLQLALDEVWVPSYALTAEFGE